MISILMGKTYAIIGGIIGLLIWIILRTYWLNTTGMWRIAIISTDFTMAITTLALVIGGWKVKEEGNTL